MIATATYPAAPPADQQTAPPEPGEVTADQSAGWRWGFDRAIAGWGSPFANGGTADNPCGFPGYGRLYCGTWETYRLMLRFPRLAQVRAQVTDRVLSNAWGWEARKGTPDAWLAFCRDALTPLRGRYVEHAIRSLDYGAADFEKVWAVAGGRYLIDRLKPLLVDRVSPLVDANGNLAGLEVDRVTGDAADRRLLLNKCVHVVYDAEAGDVWGRSRLENVRETAWRGWLDAATELYRIVHDKVAGTVPIVKTPAGEFTDPRTGGVTKWRDNAAAIINGLMRAKGVWCPTLALPASASKENVELAKASLVEIDVVDFGDLAGSIAQCMEQMKHCEALMFAGYLRSERTGTESEHGSRADSEQHTDTATLNCERVDALLAEAFNAQVVDDVLALNFGPAARGAVRAAPARMRDEHRAIDTIVITGIMADPDLRAQYLERVDVRAVTERRGIPVVGDGPIVLEAVPTDDANGAGGANDPQPDDPADDADGEDDA